MSANVPWHSSDPYASADPTDYLLEDAPESRDAEAMIAEHVTCFGSLRRALSNAVALIDDGEDFPLGFAVAGYDREDVVEQLRDWIARIPEYERDRAAMLALSAYAHDVVRTP